MFGAAETGKSSLIARFLGQAFEEAHKPTVEDFHSSQIYSGDSLCYLNIIDTSGSFEFPAMERLAMEKADAFIFVYSIDNIKSFEKVKAGLNRLCEVKDIEKVPVIVVCNKADLEDVTVLRGLQMKMDDIVDKECVVETAKDNKQFLTFESDDELSSKTTLDQERDFALKLGCKFLLTSAKFRWNVNRIFYELFAERQNELVITNIVRKRAFVNIMKLMWRKVSSRSQS